MIKSKALTGIDWKNELQGNLFDSLDIFYEKIDAIKEKYKTLNYIDKPALIDRAFDVLESYSISHRIGLNVKDEPQEYNELEKIKYLGQWLMSLGGTSEKKAKELVVVAVYNCHCALVKELLNNGWSPDWAYSEGTTALIAVASRRDAPEYREIFNEILKHSPDILIQNSLEQNALIKALKCGGEYYMGQIIDYVKNENELQTLIDDAEHKHSNKTISEHEYQTLRPFLQIKKDKMQLERQVPLKDTGLTLTAKQGKI